LLCGTASACVTVPMGISGVSGRRQVIVKTEMKDEFQFTGSERIGGCFGKSHTRVQNNPAYLTPPPHVFLICLLTLD
jgi:starvation-inducible outer membrane lipoprotein